MFQLQHQPGRDSEFSAKLVQGALLRFNRFPSRCTGFYAHTYIYTVQHPLMLNAIMTFTDLATLDDSDADQNT